jgi:transposase
MEQANIHIERIDEIPLLLQHLRAMGLAEMIDAHIRPHGNWGPELSLGETIEVWLTYILSEGDHRLCAVEGWVASLEETLRHLVSPRLTPQALCDDRLARALRYLAQDEPWRSLEEDLNRHLLRVYALPGETVRLDTSTLMVYTEVSPEGLVQFGFSKEHRPDVPQVKVALATLDPLGLPLVTLVLPGNRADDPVYTPLVEQVHTLLGAGKMYIGDSKMAAAATRAAIQRGGDVYLCPAPRTVVSEEEVWEYVKQAGQKEQIQYWQVERGDGSLLAGEGFKVVVEMRVEVGEEREVWSEERWVLRPRWRYEEAVRQMERRLLQAEAALGALNERGRGRRRYSTQEALAERVQAVLQRHQVEGLLEVTYRCEVEERSVRGYKGRPARVERREEWFIAGVKRDEKALSEKKERLGWRVYLCNGAAQGHRMSAEVVLRAYGGQFSVEQSFRRMRNRPIGVSPMYLHLDSHRVGLLRLFSLALRVLTLLEHVVRENLSRQERKLYGLYEGNPKRGTDRPTAERLLRAFKGVHLAIGRLEGHDFYHVTALSRLQEEILDLLGFSESVYTTLTVQSAQPP